MTNNPEKKIAIGSPIVSGQIGKDFNNKVEVNNSFNETNSREDFTDKLTAEVGEIIHSLCQEYQPQKASQKQAIAAKVVEVIEEEKPSLKMRLISAAKQGSLAAVEKALDNPFGAAIVAAVKDWEDAE